MSEERGRGVVIIDEKEERVSIKLLLHLPRLVQREGTELIFYAFF